jgi:ABC-2 type transport system ATP-binding protein
LTKATNQRDIPGEYNPGCPDARLQLWFGIQQDACSSLNAGLNSLANMHIALDSLSKRYSKVRALDQVSLEIASGQIVSLLGANGAGKTTLLRCLSGIVAPSAGEIRYDNEKFTRGNMELRRRIAYLPDFPIAFAHNTVLRHIGMVLRLYNANGPGIESRITDLLRGFDLMPLIDTPLAQLSRGQSYKAALCALLAADTELLLLDEPFASGMDPNGITFLKNEAQAAARRGHTIIYSTQILDSAERLSDRVCIIDRGHVRHYAPIAELEAEAGGDRGSVLENLFEQLREKA